MQDSRQEFDAVNQARTGPAEVGRGIDQECVLQQVGGEAPVTRFLHQLEQFSLRPFNGKTAGHDDKDIRIRGQDFVPRHNP
jgi:hypothetical protein